MGAEKDRLGDEVFQKVYEALLSSKDTKLAKRFYKKVSGLASKHTSEEPLSSRSDSLVPSGNSSAPSIGESSKVELVACPLPLGNPLPGRTSIEIEEPGKSNPRKQGIPFKRVRPEEVTFAKEELKSNRFLDKSGSAGSYGEKAFYELNSAKGRDFKHEKNKKKKGTYKGGRIDTTSVCSVKFDDSD